MLRAGQVYCEIYLYPLLCFVHHSPYAGFPLVSGAGSLCVNLGAAVVDEKGGLRVLPSREVLRRDALHRGSIYCLGFSPDSSLIATGESLD